MTSFFRLAALLTGFLWAALLTAAQPLPERLQRLMGDPALAASEVGIAVYDLTNDRPVFAYQDKKLYRPASVEKLIIGITALTQLGTGYALCTELFADGPVTDGTLQGNLYVRGGFDSEFGDEDMQRLVDYVRLAGIRSIAGCVVGDVSMKDSLYYGEGWSWDDARFDFQPCLSPLMYRKGCVRVTVRPGSKGVRPQVTVSPASAFYTVANEALSRTPSAGRLTVARDWMYQSNEIRVTGNADRTVTKDIPLFGSEHYFLYVFTERLQQAGISVGPYASGRVPGGARSLGVIARPLADVLMQALKESDNLSAEALFYHLGRRLHPERPVTAADAVEAIEAQITALGLDPEAYSIADGSGVSLYNYVSPDLLLSFLIHAHRHPEVFAPLKRALPTSGVDGTLAHRMKGTPAAGRVHAKTGTVTGVSSLAGYARAADGRLLAFVIINQNVLKGSRARAFQDKVCTELCR